MNVRRILRGYLVFALLITTVGVAGQNQSVKSYTTNNFASVIHLFDGLTDTENYKLSDFKPYASIYNIENVNVREDKVGVPRTKNYGLLSFDIKNDPANAFGLPGSKGNDLMSFLIQTESEAAYFDGVILKVEGVEAKMVEAAYLVDAEGVIAEGKASGEYFSFNNLRYEIEAESLVNIRVKVDLSPDLHTSDRLRMDIEKPEDLKLEVDGEAFEISAQYPVEGKYISIATPRPWSSRIEVDGNKFDKP